MKFNYSLHKGGVYAGHRFKTKHKNSSFKSGYVKQQSTDYYTVETFYPERRKSSEQ